MPAPAPAHSGQRDPHDWPVLASALLLNSPIWAEEPDFFGSDRSSSVN